MSTVAHRVTPEELLQHPDGKSYELVDGELVERTMSMLTAYVAGEIYWRLSEFVRERGLGWVFVPDAGYQCFPNEPSRVHKPDLSFVSRDRMSGDDIGKGWGRVAPDLAVEIVSQNDNARKLEEKLEDYRLAGIPVVWVVYPELRIAWIRRSDGSNERIPEPAELAGEGPLEGFRCRLDDLLPPGTSERP